MTYTSRPSASGLIVGLLAIALLAVLMALAARADAAFPGANGKIAFSSTRDGGIPQVYSMEPDGTSQVNLTNTDQFFISDSAPAWSPNGQEIAYQSRGTGSTNAGIRRMDANGTPTRGVGSGFAPAWAPDGQKIVLHDLDGEIYVVNADGSRTRITNDPAEDWNAVWSPDGQKIAFQSDRNGNFDIYVMNSDGTDQTRLTTDSGDEHVPAWSPDGQTIAFTRDLYQPGLPNGVFVMNRDGTSQTMLTGPGQGPAWAPDGRKLAFTANGGPGDASDQEVFVVNADGTGRTQITENSAQDTQPDWQPLNPAPYTRPIGTALSRWSLAPTFRPCTSANATHGSALAGASCNPPTPSSAQVAVGPRSLGFAQTRTLASGECAPFDSTHCYPDFTLIFNVTDVRSGSPTGSDYDAATWDLTGTASIQITDKYNQSVGDPSGPYDKSATTTSLSIPVPIDCVPTTDTAIGSTCAIKTTANTLLPGAAVAGRRAVLQLGQVQVLDRGVNGTPGDSDDEVFEAQGVFIP